MGLGELRHRRREGEKVQSRVDAWLLEAEEAIWDTPHAVTKRYSTASILSENRVVFNLKGNSYRLLVRIAYRLGKVIVLMAGTHAEYDRWDL